MSASAALTIAEAAAGDIDAVMAVMLDSFDPRFGEGWTAAQCAGLVPLPGVWLDLAREEDAPVGFAMGRLIAGEAELLLLAVRRGAQGRGIGRRLLEHFVQKATARGADRLHLEVREGNRAARLYMAAGFQIVGRRRNYYTGKDGELFDALTLSARPAERIR